MNKFNKQFNSKIKRFNKWQDVLARLSAFEGLVNSFDGLSQNDVHALRQIHSKLLECQDIAKQHLISALEGMRCKARNVTARC